MENQAKEKTDVIERLTNLVSTNHSTFRANPGEEVLDVIEDYLKSAVEKQAENEKHLKPRGLGEVVVRFTVDGFETIEFLFAKQLASEKRKNRQAWLAIEEKDEKDHQHTVRLKELSALIKTEPLRLPGWENLDASKPLAERFEEYFADEDVFAYDVNTIYELYLGKLLPREYFEQPFAS